MMSNESTLQKSFPNHEKGLEKKDRSCGEMVFFFVRAQIALSVRQFLPQICITDDSSETFSLFI